MDKNFTENCKLLKQHFTKLTQADTTAQSKCYYKEPSNNNVAYNIISDAKAILHSEKIEELSDEDIEQIREKSVNQYAREMKRYINDQHFCLCKRERVKWNDDIFHFPLPHPKNNKEFLKVQSKDIDAEIENERKKFEELANNILGKFENSEDSKSDKKLKSKEDVQEEKMESIIIYESKKKKNKEHVTEKSLKNEEIVEDIVDIPDTLDFEAVEIESIEIEEIPELIITPQKNKNVNFLDVKKINIEDKENTEDFDKEKEETNLELNKSSNTTLKYTDSNRQAKIDNVNKKIDNFLDVLQKFQKAKTNKSQSATFNSSNPELITTKVKPKSSTSLDSKVASYEHRYKAQKDIIEMQKQKLAEQNKLIEELKLNKIKKDAQESLEKAKEMQKNFQSTLNVKFKLKPEVKSESTVSESTKNELNLSINSNKAPKIVKMMEERAREREEKRLLIQERKRLIEEEKKRQAEEIVQRKLKEETEEKQERAKRMKQQRETVRQMELKKQLDKKRYLELNETAMEHYKKKLKQFAMHQFKMLIYNVKIKLEIAKRFYENNLVIKCFALWRSFTSNIIDNKNKLATDLYSKKLLLTSFLSWQSFRQESIQQNQVAMDRYDMSLQGKCFVSWHELICRFRVQDAVNEKKANKYYRRVLLFQCFENWRSLPAIMQIERVQNERKRKWRLRVAEVLTDYDPLKTYDF